MTVVQLTALNCEVNTLEIKQTC